MIKKLFGMIASDATKELKNNVTIKYVKDIKETAKAEGKISPAVSSSISKEEFFNRYKALRLTNIGVIALFLFCLWQALIFNSILSTIICLGFVAGLSLLYWSNSYQLWRARIVARNWSQRHKVLTTSYVQYFNVIKRKPLEFAPIKLLFK
ncbi:hypothetical protein R7Q39_11070 [Vibrio sp. 947]|uniref:hypothetical protein n=1 Tax=unclassified Vibrio TaxID=2614977 RepID=UPI0029652FEF|nr:MULTISPECIES: hypothetical protein [unclassified Vibrio]MDW1582316.1 hypothetical protein [Vibrio sp. Vb2897]MDW1640577.1 hypothetical protein [Vibrio sp. Vb2896]MDW1925960.1 hypothetical protein [Vibrio sp. 947]